MWTGAEELCRRAADANARQDPPDWRVEETISAARANIAVTTGAFADTARLAEQAAGIARAGGDLADASIELTFAAADHVLAGDAPAAVPLARRGTRAGPPGRRPGPDRDRLARCGRGRRRHRPRTGPRLPARKPRAQHGARLPERHRPHWAAGIAFLSATRPPRSSLAADAIHRLQWGGDRLRMGIVLHMIAGTLAATRPDAAAIIQGAAEAYTRPSREGLLS